MEQTVEGIKADRYTRRTDTPFPVLDQSDTEGDFHAS